MTLNDGNLLAMAREAASHYPLGVRPGLHPIEMIAGFHIGFTPNQLRALKDDDDARRLVLALLDDAGPSARLSEIAQEASPRGREHRLLLRSFGHDPWALDLSAVVERVIWMALVEAPEAVVAKDAGSKVQTNRWTLSDSLTQASVVIRSDGEFYELGVVPEVTGGPGRFLFRWSDGSIQLRRVDFIKHQPVVVRIKADGRTLTDVALQSLGAEEDS